MCRNRKLRIVQHGFTMIELMVVLAIIAIAAAIVVPIASSAGTMQLRSAVTMLAADLEYAKSMAISRGHLYAVVFDKNAESYQIEDLSKSVGDPNRIIEHPLKGRSFRYVVNFTTDSRLRDVDIVSASFDGVSAVGFDYLGVPYSVPGAGSPAPLLSNGVITLQGGGNRRTVHVEAVTGYISVSN